MTEQLREDMHRLLEGNAADCVARWRVGYERIAGSAGEGLVLCGTGYLGRKVLAALRTAGKEPLAFSDNNPALWDTRVHGLQVFSPQEAVRKYGASALFVTTVYTCAPLLEQMRNLGVAVVSFPDFAWAHPDVLLPHATLDLPHKIFEATDGVRKGLDVWEDETSRREYVGQLKWRTSLDPTALPSHLLQGEIYFPDDLLLYRDDEVFVDCGAFDGDSIREFIRRRGDGFREAVGIEADPGNFARMQRSFESMPGPSRSKLSGLNIAVGSEAKTVRFNATGTAGSSAGEGDVEARCLPLDEALGERVPTFIKMDIEGAEEDALQGARGTIERHAPVLAICLYHRQEDLWQIPLLLQSMQPRYRFFLRRYSDDCWEQVCYAVPDDRLKGSGGVGRLDEEN